LATGASVSNGTFAPTSSADWSTSYSQLLSRAAAQAATTLNLYQQALLLVSQGKLQPSAFQNELPAFIQSRGMDYANGLSELGAKFLSRLVEMSAAHARRTSASDEESEPPVPPNFDPAYPARWFEQYAEYAGKLNNRALKAYRTQLDQVAAGDASPAEVQQRTLNDLTHRMPELLQQMTQLYFDLLTGLGDMRSTYEQQYFSRVLALAQKPERAPGVSLQLSGPLGETAFVSLTVSNTTPDKVTVHFKHTDARRTDGVGPAFTPQLAVTPDVLELPAAAEHKILVSVRLLPEQFEEGHPYTCVLYIDGGSALRVEARLFIVATAAAHAASSGNREKQP
jgi:hypothetical protein